MCGTVSTNLLHFRHIIVGGGFGKYVILLRQLDPAVLPRIPPTRLLVCLDKSHLKERVVSMALSEVVVAVIKYCECRLLLRCSSSEIVVGETSKIVTTF